MKNFDDLIISWYEENKRSLPWRKTKDPYKIWLSEVILQQTRVAQGLPYYENFIKIYPNVVSLARAKEQNVLRLWQGLGYYSRARNLHRCAKKVVEIFKGVFPTDYPVLLTLPGIGAYTAAAIASFAAKQPVAVVDGNVFRVLARVFGLNADIASQEGKKIFAAKANELLSKKNPDTFNQAIMEFGALHCLPQKPKCEICIFAKVCVANRQGLQELLPLKIKKNKIRNRYFYYFFISQNNKIAMRQRSAKDIWKGLYDFYLIESSRPQKPENLLATDSFLKQFSMVHSGKTYKHILSHQHLFIRILQLKLAARKTIRLKQFREDFHFYSLRQVAQLPKPVPITHFFDKTLHFR